MSGQIVYLPNEGHRHACDLPKVWHYSHGVVWRCSECGAHWVLWVFHNGRDWYAEGPISKLKRWLARKRNANS